MFSRLQQRATAAARDYPVIEERRNEFLSDFRTLNEFATEYEPKLPLDTMAAINELLQ